MTEKTNTHKGEGFTDFRKQGFKAPGGRLETGRSARRSAARPAVRLRFQFISSPCRGLGAPFESLIQIKLLKC